MSALDDEAEGGTAFGAYVLDRRLGQGGMANVWLARRRGPAGFERAVVIKRILPTLTNDPSIVKMFLAEARLVARLHHPNIVQVFDLGDVEGEHYLAMEFVDGLDVGTVLTCYGKTLPVGFCAQVMAEVCRALAHAHAAGIVHRDVSPSNVFISREGAVKLGDFGIAKLLGDFSAERTRTGIIKGKLAYIPPEQLMGKGVDGRADVYAAGVMLYEMLTGTRLFKPVLDEDPLEMRSRRLPPLGRRDVPKALEQLCRRALAYDVEARYASAAEMATLLEKIQLDERWTSEQLRSLMRDMTRAAVVPTKKLTAAAEAITEAQPLRVARRRRRTLFRWAGGVTLGLAVAWALFRGSVPSEDLAPVAAAPVNLAKPEPPDLSPARIAASPPPAAPPARPDLTRQKKRRGAVAPAAPSDDLVEPFPGAE